MAKDSIQEKTWKGLIAPRVGDMAPDFSLRDQRGRIHKLSEFRGNFVFLNFWATWCPPCVGELPMMDSLNQKFKAKNFAMVAVSVDEDWRAVASFFRERGKSPSFMVLMDPDKEVSAGIYGTDRYPETYLIDPSGRLIKKFIGAYNWTSAGQLSEFDELFSKKTQ